MGISGFGLTGASFLLANANFVFAIGRFLSAIASFLFANANFVFANGRFLSAIASFLFVLANFVLAIGRFLSAIASFLFGVDTFRIGQPLRANDGIGCTAPQLSDPIAFEKDTADLRIFGAVRAEQ